MRHGLHAAACWSTLHDWLLVYFIVPLEEGHCYGLRFLACIKACPAL